MKNRIFNVQCTKCKFSPAIYTKKCPKCGAPTKKREKSYGAIAFSGAGFYSND